MSRDLDYVADILAAARLALGYVEGVAHERFLEDTMRQDAVIRELLIIGESAKRLSASSSRGIRASRGDRWPGCAIS